jgi:heme-degrading monooxygenase HmoA
MFAIVSTYRARVGEEDAIIALHEDWERRNQGLEGYLSWQLFRNIQAPRDFIAFAQFENEELARAATTDLKKDAWYDRLISLTEGETVHIDYMSMWQSQ